MNEKLLDKYDKVFIKSFKIKKEKLKKLKYESIPEWDSVGHMTLVAVLEEKFDCMLEMDDILDMSSYTKACEIMSRVIADG